MVDFKRPYRNQRQTVIDPSKEVKTTRVRGGPCDGTDVLQPHPGDIGKVVGIAIVAPPEHQRLTSGERTWCIYIWLPTPQQFTWLDFVTTPCEWPQQKTNDFLVNCCREACKHITPDGKRKPR